jgi:hypothetical protein
MIISPGANKLNLELPDDVGVFFSADFGSLGVALQYPGGCPVVTLGQFQILTLLAPNTSKMGKKS